MNTEKFFCKSQYTMTDLLQIMELLRGPEGCPWDREQTHTSIRNNLLEEAYETADAIDTADDTALCEELGDLLLQVVFHAQIAKEAEQFDFDNVADGICKKLILRHPHIFGDTVVADSDQVLQNWDSIKMQEKGQHSYTDTLRSVPKAFPALMRAAKIQKRAAKAGFDWDDVAGPLAKVREELDELEAVIEAEDTVHLQEEYADLLFTVVNVSRFLQIDAEQALQSGCEKFIRRFAQMEQLAAQQGMKLDTASLEQMDKLWDDVKSME